MTPEETADQLNGADFLSVDQLDLPRHPGLYAIRLSQGAWSGTPLEGTVAADPQAIAYIGKAQPPGGLRGRWRNQHLAQHSGRSSPRRSWLAVLAPAHDLPIYPRPAGEGKSPNVNCYVSNREGERWLRGWIEKHYRVATEPLDLVAAQLKQVEEQVIRILRPYANLGSPHPLWSEVFDPGRKVLIREAKARVAAGDLLALDHHS